jgi:hypothetical protein
MTKSTQRPVRRGDKVAREANTHDQGTIRLGDNAPIFRAGDKAIRDTATANQGKVRLGDMAPVFCPEK